MTLTILLALAFMLILEGIGPMLFPNAWRNYLRQLANYPANQLRTIGGALVTIGAVGLFLLL